jgi:hypothetical protein
MVVIDDEGDHALGGHGLCAVEAPLVNHPIIRTREFTISVLARICCGGNGRGGTGGYGFRKNKRKNNRLVL